MANIGIKTSLVAVRVTVKNRMKAIIVSEKRVPLLSGIFPHFCFSNGPYESCIIRFSVILRLLDFISQ